MSEPVAVVDYDPSWPSQFERLRERVVGALGDVAVRVEHVGSTAVPGLAAKPIIDLDVVVARARDVETAIERLATIGYEHQGDLGIPGREAFRSPPDAPRHHLYVCAAESEELRRHVAFRDYLRSHSPAARAYGDLKRQLAERHPHDREAYGEAKREFVERILAAAARQ